MRKSPSNPGLLRFRIAATCHVESFLHRPLVHAAGTVRAAACYDLSMLALGHHDRLSAHAAAMTAAYLLALASHLEDCGAGAAIEPAVALRAPRSADLDSDAAALGGNWAPLTQERLALALGRFRAALAGQGLDLAECLEAELAGDHLLTADDALLAARYVERARTRLNA